MSPSPESAEVALAKENVRYVVVGGVAVVLQGSPRFTADLDLVVWLDSENARRAISALAAPPQNPLEAK